MGFYNIILAPAAAPEKLLHRTVSIVVNGGSPTVITLGPTEVHAGPVEVRPGDLVDARAVNVDREGRSSEMRYVERLPAEPVEPPAIVGLVLAPSAPPAPEPEPVPAPPAL